MEQLEEMINSYLRLRYVILRYLDNFPIEKSKLMRISSISSVKYEHRIKNPDSWTIDEIEKIAYYLDFDTAPCFNAKRLFMVLDFLPADILGNLYMNAGIDRKKIKVRRYNYNKWQVHELVSISRSMKLLSTRY